jgi:hypothetical protein
MQAPRVGENRSLSQLLKGVENCATLAITVTKHADSSDG